MICYIEKFIYILEPNSGPKKLIGSSSNEVGNRINLDSSGNIYVLPPTRILCSNAWGFESLLSHQVLIPSFKMNL